MLDMVESVREYGVLVPALVREKPEGGYEMVAGHRRKMASELAEKEEMPPWEPERPIPWLRRQWRAGGWDYAVSLWL